MIIKNIIFYFWVRQGKIEQQIMLKHFEAKIKYQNYRHWKLPISMDPLKYGMIISIDKATNTYYAQVTPLTIAKLFVKSSTENHVEIFKNGRMVIKYTDKIITNKQNKIRVR